MEEEPTTLLTVLAAIRQLAESIIPVLMIFVVAIFLWGMVKYVTAAGDEEKIKSARGYIIYGLIGIFVMIAFWGIIQVFAETFGISVGGTIAPPTFTP
jgi:TRAP-type C4-dicarboxylate transport system permease small subunit